MMYLQKTLYTPISPSRPPFYNSHWLSFIPKVADVKRFRCTELVPREQYFLDALLIFAFYKIKKVLASFTPFTLSRRLDRL